MKKNKKILFPLISKLSFLILTIVVLMPLTCLAAPTNVPLYSTSNFAVLGGSAITNTGPTTIGGSAGGDIGLYPGSSFTGSTSVTSSGVQHINDEVARIAQEDLVTVYNDTAGRTEVVRINSELGGTTLFPGVYDSADGTFEITGTLTLDAQDDPDGVFIFKTASTLITASDSNVVLIGGSQSCHVFWQVGSSATLGTDSNFVGHIFALTSITATTGAEIEGQLLARNGAVTLDSNTITNNSCLAAPTEGEDLPDTATSFDKILLIGIGLTLVGTLLIFRKKRYE